MKEREEEVKNLILRKREEERGDIL